LGCGHFRREDICGAAEITLRAGISIVLPATEVLRAIPANQVLGHADELGPICAPMYLLGASFTTNAPQIALLPLAWRPLEPWATDAAVIVDARHAPFQSRAPPAA
jgi:hypothetical protein